MDPVNGQGYLEGESHPGILNPLLVPPWKTLPGYSEPGGLSVPGTGSAHGFFSTCLLQFRVLEEGLEHLSMSLRKTQDP